MTAIYLVGFMGSGKSTVGQYLAELTDLPLIDLDQVIEQEADMSIKTMFKEYGETYFRQLEHDCLMRTLGQEGIISTGGGIIERADNREWLKKQQVIFLKASWSDIVERLKHDNDRPLWQQGLADKEKLFYRRQPLYEEVSQRIIDTHGSSPERVAKIIVEKTTNKTSSSSFK
ncbi:shikimate kinase [Halolactibacillus miurensis]|uniref:Shikimate kinase n=1 Tax=Halolactibacillus miurensis TaxID=306541 RepID=A0A1I6PRY7_9BACI|nr:MULTISPECIES: shikimate kinase [Halolactibacillus]GEM04413.1 shikimate kinase [Halolactibacillus miurensis]SFS42963.1 shikimate kinase [Halolactibacillus miurensis]